MNKYYNYTGGDEHLDYAIEYATPINQNWQKDQIG